MQRSSARLAVLLSRALLEQGHDDEAFDEAAFGLRHAYDLTSAVAGRIVRVQVLTRRGQIAEALDLAREAVALAEPTDALVDKGDALLALARVLRSAGRTPEMIEATGQARAAFEAKGHSVGLTLVAEIIGEHAHPTPPSPSEVSLGPRPPERWVVEYLRRWATGDPDAVAELYSQDWRLVDHRTAGWGELHGIGQARELNRSLMAFSPDVHLAIHEIVAADDRVLALQASWRGIGANGVEGVGVGEVPLGEVIVVESGLITHQEIYEPEARLEMLRRYAELGGLCSGTVHPSG
jgi:tetratricopeptide (TPR) repeat protein